MHHRESKKEQAMEILKLKKPICPQPEPKDAKSISPTHNKLKTKARPRSVSQLQRRLAYLQRKMESISLGESQASILSDQQYYWEQVKTKSLGPINSIKKKRARSHSPQRSSIRKYERAKQHKHQKEHIKSPKKGKHKEIEKGNADRKRRIHRKKVGVSCLATKFKQTGLLESLKRQAFRILHLSRNSLSKHSGKQSTRMRAQCVPRSKKHQQRQQTHKYKALKRRLKLIQNSHTNPRRLNKSRKHELLLTHKSHDSKRLAVI